MNTKPIPAIIVLAACGISSVISISQGVEFDVFTTRFVVTAFVFLTMGIIIKIVLDKATDVLGVSDIPDVETIAEEVDTEDIVEEQPQ